MDLFETLKTFWGCTFSEFAQKKVLQLSKDQAEQNF